MGNSDDTRPATVLVVEDEPVIAESVAARLRAEGFVVHLAADGPAGCRSSTAFRSR